MNIAVAQIKSHKGNIGLNIEAHKSWIAKAVEQNAGLIIFPELSLTGYEPSLAKDLATFPDDTRFDDLQQLSNQYQIIIGAGMPIHSEQGITISMIIFQPHVPRQLYSKQYLHDDEKPFFVPGRNYPSLATGSLHIALAICYELSVPVHSEKAAANGAHIYIASVAKTPKGIIAAHDTLSAIARKYGMIVLLANCTGVCDGEECGGQSAAWDREGTRIDTLNKTEEGLLIYISNTGEIIKSTDNS